MYCRSTLFRLYLLCAAITLLPGVSVIARQGSVVQERALTGVVSLALREPLPDGAALRRSALPGLERTLQSLQIHTLAPVAPAVRTSLFRVFQELLSNVARYAEATEVAVDLVSDAETVSLIVADNGRGITEGELEGPGSLGILGMQERIHACGGSIRIHGEPGNGTTAKVTVPLKASGDSAWQTRLGLP